MLICKNCGKELNEKVDTCPLCGKSEVSLYNYTMSFKKVGEARKSMMSKWKTFEGRSRRNEFWKSSFLNILYIIGMIFLGVAVTWIMWTPTQDAIADAGGAINDMDICAYIALVVADFLIIFFTIRFIIAQISMTVRRLHDLGKSGLLLMVSALPAVAYVVMQVCVLVLGGSEVFALITAIVGWVALVLNVAFLVWMMMEGKEEDNAYGTSPKIIIRKKMDDKKAWE